ncbi:Tetratricopeptide TPR_1 repeat-containing protein [Desulfobulbus propionicus DSM 2032]|jgi:Cytochrome c biogenesis factor|uniref:Tetratricopeptide TPR_1 repeat-containing protein n=1 Tax=Desulfobulbus propionicus (strain ATCC 33891 / DSM 2032 / VKM B-1956 / 1pr3) TaxID=577650 RepID=A0A7U3YL50_DESPD|nr:tetratricopeptide repeat protein [Desulfobulbus propionicus]ADW17375.1 Tetratricopeptide TPR_1 repeat-containing protein [Desulfobulbus propionicus DSM 2032]
MFKLTTTVALLILCFAVAQGLRAGQAPEQTTHPAVARPSPAAQEQPPPPQPSSRSHDQWLKGSEAFQESSDWKGMLDWCQEWSRDVPEDAWAWHCLGYCYLNLHRYDEAVAAYRQTVRINPQDADGWSNLGFVYTEQKRYNEAIDSYRQTVRINPGDVEGWSNLSYVYFSSDNPAAAQESLEQLRHLNPQKADELLEILPPPK